ncbi:MAG: PHP domain-containing protein [bacterium]|nr:PHP domain-containing protein [bacterium]
MSEEVLGVFYENGSGKSILTNWSLKEVEDAGDGCPVSLVQLAKEEGLKEILVISSNFRTFIPLLENMDKIGVKLTFGLEILMTKDADDHSDISRWSNYKVIVIAKNSKGRLDLFKIFSAWKTRKENKYYDFRFDEKQLLPLLTQNLQLVYPFFNSPIAKNLLVHNSNIVPNPPPDTILFREVDSEHPHEDIINSTLNRYNGDKRFREIRVKSIYYKNREDFKKLLVFKTILSGDGNFSAPEMSYCCSDAFCYESLKEVNKKV